MQTAVWYMDHGATAVEICDDEDEAAGFAVGLEDCGLGSVCGFQLEDGTLVSDNDAKTWEPYVRAQQRQEAAYQLAKEQEASRPKPLTREATNPFHSNVWQTYTIQVPVDTPSWVG